MAVALPRETEAQSLRLVSTGDIAPAEVELTGLGHEAWLDHESSGSRPPCHGIEEFEKPHEAASADLQRGEY